MLTEMIQQFTTPNTVPDMLLGYAFIFGTGLFYIASLMMRRRSLQRDLVVLEQIDDE
ncbi:MAG: hypothetical protein GYB68_00835 [Chloroflexi bacterium]|nr:hypothetical protein [Chloroflexota bacterium]